MIALILLMHPHVYICVYMYACMRVLFFLHYTRPPPPAPSIEVDLAGLATPSPLPNIEKLPTPMYP